ncbi:maltose ABC transporter permease MalF [Pelagibacterium limicola]|uniref:maltose ABC transporter permease MalF n=1 Tax=Pelagibacterium limicola TaxID=2791022 RepID=UPI001FE73B31|nr:maltose ABC transporter permease MalF [Pelagibacterium limicola]
MATMALQRDIPPAGSPLELRTIVGTLIKWALLAVYGLALLYIAWGLYAAGEALFAAVVLALMVGTTIVFGLRRFYTIRFIFPAVMAVLIFIALPVGFTSYVGFTNFGARNLLTQDRVIAYHMQRTIVDASTERPFVLSRDVEGYRLFLPEGEGGFISEPFALDGSPVEIGMTPVSQAPETVLEMRDVVQLRGPLGAVTAVLPDGTDLTLSGLRSFATVRPVYEEQPDGSLLNIADGTVLTPDQSVGFYRNEEGQAIAPGWRVHVGWANFQRVLFSDNVRQPMLQIFVWTVVFAFLSMVLTFSVGILLASLLQWPHLRFKGFYRIMLVLPYAVPAFISILVFRGLFNQNFGEINLILQTLFGIKPQWFTDPNLARAMTLIVNTWLGYPYMMLLGMGYLQAIPQDHYKAAALEGSGPLRNFFAITLPQLLPPFVPLLIANFAFNFNNVVLILLLTRGLPNIPGTEIPAGATDILGSFTYRMSFNDAGQNFGMAGAISTLIFIVVAIIAYANFVAMRRYAAAKGRGQ